ncbi:MAG TPA: hypothetical protein QF468_12395 [Nitrospinota bacterium]|jgi:hypothetical protein|nr:hypothetical protein [Nitrospinota bacterium]|tara:strand:+ start:714 stop:905 length:192 start_codon:yes stop_codon:yes gene_type:complete
MNVVLPEKEELKALLRKSLIILYYNAGGLNVLEKEVSTIECHIPLPIYFLISILSVDRFENLR